MVEARWVEHKVLLHVGIEYVGEYKWYCRLSITWVHRQLFLSLGPHPPRLLQRFLTQSCGCMTKRGGIYRNWLGSKLSKDATVCVFVSFMVTRGNLDHRPHCILLCTVIQFTPKGVDKLRKLAGSFLHIYLFPKLVLHALYQLGFWLQGKFDLKRCNKVKWQLFSKWLLTAIVRPSTVICVIFSTIDAQLLAFC